MIKALQRLGELCRMWGGELRVLGHVDEFDKYFPERDPFDHGTVYGRSKSPFAEWHGIDWRKKRIVTVHGQAKINAVIHEMGHVFASRHHPDSGDGDAEFDFFGWEVAVAKMVGAFRTWSAGNNSYSVTDDGDSWGNCAGHKRRRIIVERVARARELKLLDAFLRPVAIR